MVALARRCLAILLLVLQSCSLVKTRALAGLKSLRRRILRLQHRRAHPRAAAVHFGSGPHPKQTADDPSSPSFHVRRFAEVVAWAIDTAPRDVRDGLLSPASGTGARTRRRRAAIYILVRVIEHVEESDLDGIQLLFPFLLDNQGSDDD